MTPKLDGIFGNRTASCVALFIERFSTGYANEIATTFGIRVNAVQTQLRRLEAAGILESEVQGRMRFYRWSSRSRTVNALRGAVAVELEHLSEDPRAEVLIQRRRPRRQGKPLNPATAPVGIEETSHGHRTF